MARPWKPPLFGANIPVQVYKQLLTDINANLSTLHRYLELRKRMLKLEKLYYYDMYPSLVKDVNIPFPYDSSQEIILESLKPLGPEYRKALEETFGNRWIDVYPNEGKRQGAYSNGSFYTGHPYVLLNYNDDYESISTLAHELGHNNHSYFSSKTSHFLRAIMQHSWLRSLRLSTKSC